MDLKTFAKEIYKDAEQIEDEITHSISILTGVILTKLAVTSPIDTSLSVSNWQVSLGRPALSTTQPYYAGKGGSTATSSGKAMVEAGKAEVKLRRPGETVYISNTINYTYYINYQSESAITHKTPGFFVEASILAGITYLGKLRL